MFFMGELGRDARRLATEIDRTNFDSARQRIQELFPLLPESYKIPNQQLHSIDFVTDEQFLFQNFQDLLDSGYDSTEAAAEAKRRVSTLIVGYLENAGKIIARPVPDMTGISGSYHKADLYMSWIANSYANVISSTKGDISYQDISQVTGLDKEEAQKVLLRNLHHDPYVFAEFVNQKTGTEYSTFFEQFLASGPPTEMNRVEYLRSRLRNGYAAVLQELEMDVDEYDSFVDYTLARNVRGKIGGRIIELELLTDDNGRYALGEMGYARDYLLRELHADAFSLYIMYLDFIRFSDVSIKKASNVEKARLFKKSKAYRDTLYSPDNLTNFAIADLAIAAGGYEEAMNLLHNANTPTYEVRKVSDQVAGALRECVDAYHAKNVISYLTLRSITDPQYFLQLGLDPLTSIVAQQGSEVTPFTPGLLITQAAAFHGAYDGVYEAATGTLSKNEHIMWRTDNEQIEGTRNGDVLGILRDRLHHFDEMRNPDQAIIRNSLEYARRVLGHNTRYDARAHTSKHKKRR